MKWQNICNKVIELPMWDHQDKQIKAEAKTMLEKYMKKRR